MEAEAKFLVKNPSVFQQMGRLTSVGKFRLTQRVFEKQFNTYLDTEDLRLRKARLVLKLRQVGPHAEVTFKREIRYAHGISERMEVTRPIPVTKIPLLYAGQLRVEPVRLARRAAAGRPLRKVFTLVTRRRKRIFSRGTERLELDLDWLGLKTNRGTIPIHLEIEMENLCASPESFRSAVKELQEKFGKKLRLSRVPKYEAGFRCAL